MHLLAYLSYERKVVITAHFRQESPHTEKGKFIYKALTHYMANSFSNVID